jgi:hypothetical protein
MIVRTLFRTLAQSKRTRGLVRRAAPFRSRAGQISELPVTSSKGKNRRYFIASCQWAGVCLAPAGFTLPRAGGLVFASRQLAGFSGNAAPFKLVALPKQKTGGILSPHAGRLVFLATLLNAGRVWPIYAGACAGACSGGGRFQKHCGHTVQTPAGCAPSAPDRRTWDFPVARPCWRSAPAMPW